MGLVSIDGRESTVCLACTPEAIRGSVILVHSGFAVEVLDASDLPSVSEFRLEAVAHRRGED